MRKKLCTTMVLGLLAGCMALFGCSSGPSTNASTTDAPKSDAQQATQQEEKKNDAKYAVTIDDCLVTPDYEDKSAVVITYTFTNNAEKATSFMAAVSAKCFQNGVELESAVIMGDAVDAQSTLNELKTGATTTVQRAYLLSDESEISVECSELISFSDAILAEKTFSVV